MHHWAEENPHVIVQSRHQQNIPVNVWVDIVGDSFIVPEFLLPRLNGYSYLHFLENNLNN